MKIPANTTFSQVLYLKDIKDVGLYRWSIEFIPQDGTPYTINDIVANSQTQSLFWRQAPANPLLGPVKAILHRHPLNSTCCNAPCICNTDLGYLFEFTDHDTDDEFTQHKVVSITSTIDHQVYSWQMSGGGKSALNAPFYYGFVELSFENDTFGHPKGALDLSSPLMSPYLAPLSNATGAEVTMSLPIPNSPDDDTHYGIYFICHADFTRPVAFICYDHLDSDGKPCKSGQDFLAYHDHLYDYACVFPVPNPDPDAIDVFEPYIVQRVGCTYSFNHKAAPQLSEWLNTIYLRLS